MLPGSSPENCFVTACSILANLFLNKLLLKLSSIEVFKNFSGVIHLCLWRFPPDGRLAREVTGYGESNITPESEITFPSRTCLSLRWLCSPAKHWTQPEKSQRIFLTISISIQVCISGHGACKNEDVPRISGKLVLGTPRWSCAAHRPATQVPTAEHVI